MIPCFVLLFPVLAQAPASHSPRLELHVTPLFASAPADLLVRATVEPSPGNRVIQIDADSENYFRSSAMELDGARAPRSTMLRFRSVPSGEYEVRAVVTNANGQSTVARCRVLVVGPQSR